MRAMAIPAPARRGQSWLFLSILLFKASASAAGSGGSPECPCIASPKSDVIVEEALRLGLPRDYGTAGCQAWDRDAAYCHGHRRTHETGSSYSEPRCEQSWCYVDPSTCPVDLARCAAVGGIPGSAAPEHLPWCRERTMAASHVMQNLSNVFFSYETCGDLNFYGDDPLKKALSGRALFGTALASNLGYSKLTPAKQWTGAYVEFFIETIQTKSNTTRIDITDAWATPGSLARYNTSYSACALDVALGNYDFCLGDFWITPERQILTDFTPAVQEDLFYLVVPEDRPYDSLAETLAKPFEPFTAQAWAGILGFLAISSIVFYVTDHRNVDDYPYAAHDLISRAFKASYFALSGFFAGAPSHSASTLPAKISMVGFLFFVLVVLASYTANLASILVGQQSISDIPSIEIAIRSNMRICVAEARTRSLQDNYPNARLVPTGTHENPRFMHRGLCGAAVMSQSEIDKMQAGQSKDKDCADLASGLLSEEESACNTGFDGEPRDDCKLVRVGGIVQSVPIGFPISKLLADSMKWAVLTGVIESKMKDWMEVYAEDFPASDNQCTAIEDSATSVSLGLDSLLGTLYISLIFLLSGLALSIVEHVLDRDITSILLCRMEKADQEPEEESIEGIVPCLRNPNLRRASQASDRNARQLVNSNSRKIREMHSMFAKMLEHMAHLEEMSDDHPGRTASAETFTQVTALRNEDTAGSLAPGPVSNVSSPNRATPNRNKVFAGIVDHEESSPCSSRAMGATGIPVHFSARPELAEVSPPNRSEWSEWT